MERRGTTEFLTQLEEVVSAEEVKTVTKIKGRRLKTIQEVLEEETIIKDRTEFSDHSTKIDQNQLDGMQHSRCITLIVKFY